MAYCDADDVVRYCLHLAPGGSFTTTTKPTLAQVNEFIADAAAQIDSALGVRGLSVPITSPDYFVADLLAINAQGAAARAWATVLPSRGSGSTGNDLGASLSTTYERRLSEFRRGIGVPVGLAVAENDLSPRSFFTDQGAIGEDSNNATDPWGDTIDSNPSFSREMRF